MSKCSLAHPGLLIPFSHAGFVMKGNEHFLECRSQLKFTVR